MPIKRDHLSFLFSGLLVALGLLPFSGTLYSQDVEAPLPPPQSPNYYLQRYGTLAVPAILGGRDYVMIDGWIEKLEKGPIIKGVDQQGRIRYRMAKVFEIEPKPTIGYRFYGNGYQGEGNPTITLNVGESYIFKISQQQLYPMLIHKINPDQPFQFFPYNSFELLNNHSDISQMRFTPRPDTPDELVYQNQKYREQLKGTIRINKTPLQSLDGEISLTVIVRRQIIDKYLELLAEGFIPEPLSLGAETIEFYEEIQKAFKVADTWYSNLETYKEPGHKLIWTSVNPENLVQGINFTPQFPAPQILDPRIVHTLDSRSRPVQSKKYLLKVKISPPIQQFVRKLLDEEAKINPEIRKILNDPKLLNDQIKESYATRLLEVDHKVAYQQFQAKQGAFENELSRFKNLNITYAIDNDAYQRAQSLIFQGDYIRGLHELRPIVYPLIKLAPIPKYFGSTRISYFQDHVEYLLEALLEAAKSEKIPENYQTNFMYEAFAIVYMLPLYELDNKEFIRKALSLVALLAKTGRDKDSDRANYLLNLIPFDKDDEESVIAFFNVAENFRSSGNYPKALEIYEQFFPLTSHVKYREACLWSAFCRASSTPPQFGASQLSLDKFIDTYKKEGRNEPPRDSKYYSLWRLVEAILYYRDPLDKLDLAMDRISEAVVYSRIGYEWVPEILALSAQCYAKKGFNETASNVFRELKVFFPKHPKTRQFEIDFPNIAGN
jgi:tetratricopeptide (TPR) repeat protein